MKNYFKLVSITLFTLLFVACSSDDDAAPEPVNEEEVITTLNVILDAGDSEVTLSYQDLSGDGSRQMILGLYMRNGDAVIPVFGFQLNDTRFTFNYDATVSTLKAANNTRGAYELSIIKTGAVSSALARGVRCPSVKF